MVLQIGTIPRITWSTRADTGLQAQTPQQRQANARYAKAQEKKMGKPESAQAVKPRGPQKSPISKTWISTWHSGRTSVQSLLMILS